MSKIGQKAILTQKQVIQFFKDQLGYDYLDDWKDRENNSNIEEGYLTDWLKRQGHNDKIIGKVCCTNWVRPRPSVAPRRSTTSPEGTLFETMRADFRASRMTQLVDGE